MVTSSTLMKKASSRLICLMSLFVIVAFVDGQEVLTPFDNGAWPTTTEEFTSRTLPGVRQLYDHFMEGCNNATKENGSCKSGEYHRLLMNRLQPKSVRNFTKIGFKKIRAPDEIFSLIKKFWEDNRNDTKIEWKAINTYHNMWDSPPTFISIEDTTKIGGGPEIKDKIWKGAKKVLEAWTGQSLSGSSIYGIRLYHNNSILAPHVDRHPLVTSAIINVEQDVDEEWPLEVYGHDGKAYNVSMKPGDMVLYESHSVLHGRPYPMKGNFFANIFLHFEPAGALMDGSLPTDPDVLDSIDAKLPPYYITGSEWEKNWKASNPDGWHLMQGYLKPGKYARTGNLKGLKEIELSDGKISLFNRDHNGWGPIHEAARAGHASILKYLVNDVGVDVNERTNFGRGHSPLRLALQYLGEDHPATVFLRAAGGISTDATAGNNNGNIINNEVNDDEEEKTYDDDDDYDYDDDDERGYDDDGDDYDDYVDNGSEEENDEL